MAQVLNRRFGTFGARAQQDRAYWRSARSGRPHVSPMQPESAPTRRCPPGYDLLTGWSKRWSKNAPFFFLRLPAFAGVFFVKSTS